MDINKIPPHILKDLLERCTEEEIKGCSPEYLFNEYCEWNGLRSWGGTLINVLRSLEEADKGGL